VRRRIRSRQTFAKARPFPWPQNNMGRIATDPRRSPKFALRLGCFSSQRFGFRSTNCVTSRLNCCRPSSKRVGSVFMQSEAHTQPRSSARVSDADPFVVSRRFRLESPPQCAQSRQLLSSNEVRRVAFFPSSPIGVSRLIGLGRIFITLADLLKRMDSLAANSSGVGSAPISCRNLTAGAHDLVDRFDHMDANSDRPRLIGR